MGLSRAVSLALGTIAILSGGATLSFNIIFATTLSNVSAANRAHIIAIVSSTLWSVTVVLLLLLLYRQIIYRSGTHIQNSGARQHTYLLAGFGGVLGILSSAASAVLLGMMRNNLAATIPLKTLGSSTEDLVTVAFIIWAVTLLSQALFVVCTVVIQRKDFQQQIQPYRADSEQHAFPQMQESMPHDANIVKDVHQRIPPLSSSPASPGRSRAGSDTRSFRSSLSQVVRPMNSKTKLIQPSLRSPYRPQSVESNQQESRISGEDGFDSWDFSTVDPQSRKAVESASPPPQRFLPTIPASPTGSRSPSPGFPLDLEPPKTRKRSRSYSPASSQRERPKTARTISPTESMNEAHIHPLFRTDSPTPPPAASAATVVVAAIGGGQVMSDRQSIRSIQRMRSGSLPSTPLMHTPSLESIRRAMEREEWEKLEIGTARKMTPPIPDFVLHGGPRSSMHGYNARKKSQAGGPAKLGEDRNN